MKLAFVDTRTGPFLQAAHTQHDSPYQAIYAYARQFEIQLPVIKSMLEAVKIEAQSASSGSVPATGPEAKPEKPRESRGPSRAARFRVRGA